MNKQEALAMLAMLTQYLPPDKLSAFMQFWWQSGLEAANGPASANGHISYSEALSRRLCPYCGDQGIPYGDQDFEDQDFDRYQCSNLHVFYVSKEMQ